MQRTPPTTQKPKPREEAAQAAPPTPRDKQALDALKKKKARLNGLMRRKTVEVPTLAVAILEVDEAFRDLVENDVPEEVYAAQESQVIVAVNSALARLNKIDPSIESIEMLEANREALFHEAQTIAAQTASSKHPAAVVEGQMHQVQDEIQLDDDENESFEDSTRTEGREEEPQPSTSAGVAQSSLTQPTDNTDQNRTTGTGQNETEPRATSTPAQEPQASRNARNRYRQFGNGSATSQAGSTQATATSKKNKKGKKKKPANAEPTRKNTNPNNGSASQANPAEPPNHQFNPWTRPQAYSGWFAPRPQTSPWTAGPATPFPSFGHPGYPQYPQSGGHAQWRGMPTRAPHAGTTGQRQPRASGPSWSNGGSPRWGPGVSTGQPRASTNPSPNPAWFGQQGTWSQFPQGPFAGAQQGPTTGPPPEQPYAGTGPNFGAYGSGYGAEFGRMNAPYWQPRVSHDLWMQYQLPFPPGWEMPAPGEIPYVYRNMEADKVIEKNLIKPFLGTIEDYPRFYHSFYDLVHIQPGPLFHKILALDKLITDTETVELFAGLGMTPGDYVQRLSLLENKYGGEDRLRSQQLRNLRQIQGDMDSSLETFRRYTHTLQTYLRNSPQSEADNHVLLDMLKDKMSHSLIVQYNAFVTTYGMYDNSYTLAQFLAISLANEERAREARKPKPSKSKDKEKEKSNKIKPAGATILFHQDRAESGSDSESIEYDNEETQALFTAQGKTGKLPMGTRPLQPERKTMPTKPKPTKKESSSPCGCCQSKEHRITQCEKFYLMLPGERRSFAATNGICFLCLQTGHYSKGCPRQQTKCGICGEKHHFMLHPAPAAAVNFHGDDGDLIDFDADSQYLNCAFLQSQGKEQTGELDTALMVFTVMIRNPATGKEVQVNLLADTGANNSCIDDGLAKELGLDGPREPYRVQVGGGQILSYSSFVAMVELQAVQDHAKPYQVRLQVYKKPCGKLGMVDWSTEAKNWDHLKALNIPAPANRPIQGIIGTSEMFLLSPLERAVTRGRHDPVAFRSRLGWMVGGAVKQASPHATNIHVSLMMQEETNPRCCQETKRALDRLWSAEHPGMEDIIRSRRPAAKPTKAEKTAERRFDETQTRLEDGRYQVGLLWKENALVPYNYREALQAFHVLEKQMERQPEMRHQFVKTVSEWINKDIAQWVKFSEHSDKVFYSALWLL